MTLSLRLAALALAVLSSLAFTAAPPPRPLGPAEVQKLIEQLGDRDYRAREQAEKRLVAEGTVALPLLRKAMGHKDAEVRRRALRLVPGLEHAAIVAPKRVTMDMQNQPLNAIFAEISKQTGYQIQHQGGMVFANGGGPGIVMAAPAVRVVKGGKAKAAPAAPREATFSYTFVNEPFWDVIDRICRDRNLYIQQGHYGDEVVRLYQGAGTPPHAGRDGAFRYAAANMQLQRYIDLSTNSPAASRNETLTLIVALFAEPRLPFLTVGEVRLESAYDSENNSMIPKANPANFDEMNGMRFSRRYHGGYYKQVTMQTSMNLTRVSEKANSIKLLKGVAPVTILVEQKPMPISDDIMKGKGKKTQIGDLEFHVEDVTKQNNQVSVKFTVTNKGNPNDYTWQNTLNQRLELHDDKGQKFNGWNQNWHGGGNNSVGMTMSYGNNGGVKIGEAKRFVYQHWVTRQHDIHFELRDVPLP